MRFYDCLQWDTAALKKAISSAENKAEKHWFLKALLVKDVLIVGFSVLFITLLTTFFNQANSSMAVVLFCILLSVRFVDFGYKASNALVNFAVVLLVLWIVPCMSVDSALGAFLVHFCALGFVILATCENPQMGNGGLYLFSYVFLCGNPVSGDLFWLRGGMCLVGFLLCGAVYAHKHRLKHQDLGFADVVKGFNLTVYKNQWQLQMVLGMSLLFFLNELLDLPYFMWSGFACASLLSTPSHGLKEKGIDRMRGIVMGCLLFAVLYQLLPASLASLLGIAAGLCLGVCASYRYKTVCNCFGALLLASGIYGLGNAVYLRVFNNFIGTAFGLLFFWAYQKYMSRIRSTM